MSREKDLSIPQQPHSGACVVHDAAVDTLCVQQTLCNMDDGICVSALVYPSHRKHERMG